MVVLRVFGTDRIDSKLGVLIGSDWLADAMLMDVLVFFVFEIRIPTLLDVQCQYVWVATSKHLLLAISSHLSESLPFVE